MKLKPLITHAAITFCLTLVVSALVSWLWSLIRHGAGSADWETSFRLAVILGLVIPLATGGHFGSERSKD
jgi:hypothetical protein